MRPITKWAHRITHTHRIPDLVAQALRTATTGRPGPVFLELPIDVLFARVDEEQVIFPAICVRSRRLRRHPRQSSAPSSGSPRPSARSSSRAAAPGSPAPPPSCWRFAERTGIPGLLPTARRTALVPPRSPALWPQLRQPRRAASRRHAAGPRPRSSARVSASSPAAAAALSCRRRRTDLRSTSRARRSAATATSISASPPTAARRSAPSPLAAREQKWPDRAAWQAAVHAGPRGSRRSLRRRADGDAPPDPSVPAGARGASRRPGPTPSSSPTGARPRLAGHGGRVPRGGHWLSHGYLGCLGTGMPFAIAAKVAHPDRPVVCVIGDGSVGLNFAEFDTMVAPRPAIVTVVNNDRQWGMSAHGQELIFGAGGGSSPTRGRRATTSPPPASAATPSTSSARRTWLPRSPRPRRGPPGMRERHDRPGGGVTHDDRHGGGGRAAGGTRGRRRARRAALLQAAGRRVMRAAAWPSHRPPELRRRCPGKYADAR